MKDIIDRILQYSLDNPCPMYKTINFIDDKQGCYWLSPYGDLISFYNDVPHRMKFNNNGRGYYYTTIRGKKFYLHRLLAKVYNEDKRKNNIHPYVVHHLDFNRKNNRLDNLCIMTPEKHRKIHSLYNKWQAMEHNC